VLCSPHCNAPTAQVADHFSSSPHCTKQASGFEMISDAGGPRPCSMRTHVLVPAAPLRLLYPVHLLLADLVRHAVQRRHAVRRPAQSVSARLS